MQQNLIWHSKIKIRNDRTGVQSKKLGYCSKRSHRSSGLPPNCHWNLMLEVRNSDNGRCVWLDHLIFRFFAMDPCMVYPLRISLLCSKGYRCHGIRISMTDATQPWQYRNRILESISIDIGYWISVFYNNRLYHLWQYHLLWPISKTTGYYWSMTTPGDPIRGWPLFGRPWGRPETRTETTHGFVRSGISPYIVVPLLSFWSRVRMPPFVVSDESAVLSSWAPNVRFIPHPFHFRGEIWIWPTVNNGCDDHHELGDIFWGGFRLARNGRYNSRTWGYIESNGIHQYVHDQQYHTWVCPDMEYTPTL